MLIELVDKLVDRSLQLLTIRKAGRRELLDDQVSPLFDAFDAVHKAYLTSFARYREALQDPETRWDRNLPLLDEIRRDNLFSEADRIRIVQLGQAAEDPQLGPFIAAMRDYLVDSRVAVDPIAGYRGAAFRNPQLWRRTLVHELETVAEGRWAMILDRSASGPPVYGSEAEAALRDVRRQIGISENDPRKLDRTKSHFALRALDEVVGEMQEAYGRVVSEYARLREQLRK